MPVDLQTENAAWTPKVEAIVDLGDSTVLPGFVDGHAHLLWQRPLPATDIEPVAVLYGLAVAQEALTWGVTSVVDLGSPGRSAFHLRRALGDVLLGPHLYASGPPLTTTAGHGAEIGRIADDAQELVVGVRRLVAEGADLVKIMASGGLMDDDPSNRRRAQYKRGELALAIDDAHRLRRKVVVHANATEAIGRAVGAGADAVAHCNFLGATDDTVVYDASIEKDFTRRRVAVDLNMGGAAAPIGARDGRVVGWPGKDTPATRWALLARLRDQGVPMYFTSDAIGGYASPFPALLYATMRALDLEIGDALRRVTSVPAAVLGLDAGSVRGGAMADLVAFRGDLRAAPDLLLSAPCVMRGGVIVAGS